MGPGEMRRMEFVEFLSAFIRNLVAYSMDGAIHFQCIDWRHMAELQAAGEASYAEFKNLIVWNKGNAGMGSFYRSQHELIQVWKVGTAPHINNFGLGAKGRYRTNVWNYPGATASPTLCLLVSQKSSVERRLCSDPGVALEDSVGVALQLRYNRFFLGEVVHEGTEAWKSSITSR